MSHASEPLHERMARSIDRLRAGCRKATGVEPTIDPPPTDEQIAAAAHDLGRPIPAPLLALYRVADGLEAYGFALNHDLRFREFPRSASQPRAWPTPGSARRSSE